MPDFLDILPPARTGSVTVFGHDFPIRPLKNRQWAYIARRFPEVRKTLFTDAPDDMRSIAMMEAQPAIIAAGLGKLNNKEFENAIEERLPDEEKAKLFNAIMELTFPATEVSDGPLESAAEIVAAAKASATTSVRL